MDRRAVLGGTAACLLPIAAPTAGAATARVGVPGATAAVAVGEATRPVTTVPVDPGCGESLALARHVASTPYERLSVATVAMTRRSILDAIGVSMAASGLEPACRPFLDFALESGAAPRALVLGTGRRTSVELAALANGALAHALDYEDAHDPSRTHPNAAAVAAALSLADVLPGVSGRDFLLAVALGCDVTCRLSMAQGNVDSLPRAFYPPAIVGTFGATAAAARLLRLTPGQVLAAFSLALCQNSCSAEILSDAHSDLRAVRDGQCAQAGVQAAMLAARGVRGFERPIEGERGFYAMYADGRHRPGVLTEALGERFEGERVGFKAWPACRDAHPYIQAALDGLRREPIDVAQVEDVHVYVPRRSLIVTEPAEPKRRPRAAIDAKFSLYFTLAAAIVHREITLQSFEPRALADPAVLGLARKVRYSVDETRTRLDGSDERVLIELRLRDGSARAWGIRRLYGSVEHPLDDATLVAKFVDCGRAAQRPLGAADLRRLADRLLALEQVEDMKTLSGALA